MITSAAPVSVPALTAYAERMQRAIAPIAQMAHTLREAGAMIAEAVAEVRERNRQTWNAFTEALAQKRSERYRPASKPAEVNHLEAVTIEAGEVIKRAEHKRRRCRSVAFADGFLIDFASSPHSPPDRARTSNRPPP